MHIIRTLMGLQFVTVVTHDLVSVFLSFNIPLKISHGCTVGLIVYGC